MNTTLFSPRQVMSWMRRHSIFVVVVGFTALLVLAGRPVWAADSRSDISQTVPPPTPRPEPPGPSEPTPAPDDEEDAGGSVSPTGTAATPGAQPAVTTGAATAAPTVTVETGTVTTVVLNVRAGPGTDFEVLGKLKSGNRVTLLERSPAGDWFNVCCVPGTQTQGWVSAEYIALDPATKVVQLPVPTPTPGAVDAVATSPAVTTTAVITVIGQQQPSFSWQSQPITLMFTIEIDAASPANQVRFRYEVPAGLTLIGVDNKGGKSVTAKTAAGRALVTVSWPNLPANSTQKVGVRLQVDEDLPNGTVLNSLVAVTSRNGGATSAGVVTGLPPAAPPDFQ